MYVHTIEEENNSFNNRCKTLPDDDKTKTRYKHTYTHTPGYLCTDFHMTSPQLDNYELRQIKKKFSLLWKILNFPLNCFSPFGAGVIIWVHLMFGMG